MISISYGLWYKLGFHLRNEGNLQRESGAFLLARRNSRKIIDFVSYLSLDSHAYDSGIIKFDGSGLVKLSKYCQAKNLDVIADIHTHPSRNTRQSFSDKTHPMIKIKGHVSLIAPSYFRNPFTARKYLGTYEYLGGSEWSDYSKSNYFQMTIL